MYINEISFNFDNKNTQGLFSAVDILEKNIKSTKNSPLIHLILHLYHDSVIIPSRTLPNVYVP